MGDADPRGSSGKSAPSSLDLPVRHGDGGSDGGDGGGGGGGEVRAGRAVWICCGDDEGCWRLANVGKSMRVMAHTSAGAFTCNVLRSFTPTRPSHISTDPSCSGSRGDAPRLRRNHRQQR